MMKHLVRALVVAACAAAPLSAAELQLSIQDGRVSLDAQDVTIRQILAEWERIGKTRIVNAERIAGGPVTLKLEGVPEKQALDIVLRTVPGYMAVPRETVVADASVYDRILIMPTTAAVAAARPGQTTTVGSRLSNLAALAGGANVTQLRPTPPPAPLQGGQAEPSDPADDQADDPAIAAAAAAGLIAVPAQNPGSAPAPGASPFAPLLQPQQPRQPEAPQPAAPSNPWNAPTGTSRPTLAPPPPAPGAQPQIRPRPPEPDR